MQGGWYGTININLEYYFIIFVGGAAGEFDGIRMILIKWNIGIALYNVCGVIHKKSSIYTSRECPRVELV